MINATEEMNRITDGEKLGVMIPIAHRSGKGRFRDMSEGGSPKPENRDSKVSGPSGTCEQGRCIR